MLSDVELVVLVALVLVMVILGRNLTCIHRQKLAYLHCKTMQ